MIRPTVSPGFKGNCNLRVTGLVEDGLFHAAAYSKSLHRSVSSEKTLDEDDVGKSGVYHIASFNIP